MKLSISTNDKVNSPTHEGNNIPHPDNIIRTITTVNGEEIKFIYSTLQKTVSAYVVEGKVDNKGKAEVDVTEFTEKFQKTVKLIKYEDLPKELVSVKDPVTFELLLENSYARTSHLSNGDVKLYIEQRGFGGGKEDRVSPYWQKLLSNIKELAEARAMEELALKAFISYAWEDTSTDVGKAANSKLQRWLEGLRDDLQQVGVSVFLDIGDMHGDMGKRMRENLDESDLILTINTPRYAQRATSVPQTNLGFEYELTLKKAEINPKSVITLHYEGELDKAFPETLKQFPRYDCRSLEDYSESLVGNKGLSGIIPTILGINVKEDPEYQDLVQQWRQEKLNYLPEYNKEFVGRAEQLEKLKKALEAKPVQTIIGKEGIGKSELVLKYTNDHAEQYKIMRWINATPDNLKKEFKQMAQELAINTKGAGIRNVVEAVYTNLKSLPNWLLIFDNAVDRSTIEAYLPKPTEKGQHVIITSRSQEQWKSSVEMKGFSKAEAWEYIHQKLPNVSQSQAVELASKVQYAPGKLQQAVEYISTTGISVSYYIKTHLTHLVSSKSKEVPVDTSSKARIEKEEQEKISEGTATNSQKVSLVESNNTTGKASKDHTSSKTDSVSGTKKKNVADFPSLLSKIKEEVLQQVKKEQVKAYISYAPEDVTTSIGEEKNEKMQSWIEKLQGSLEQAGIVVTISSRDIHGNIEPEAEIALNNSDAILLINTPTYKQQVLSSAETDLGYEYKQILERAKEIPYGMLPLLYSGGFGESVPRELWGFLVRDCTNESAYEENLVASQNPKGIIAGIYNIDCDDTPKYRSLVQEWRWHKATILPTANPNFLGREEVLVQLAKSFEEAKDATSQRQVVSATGGMGKSELAITYANKHVSEYDMVRWLNTEGDKLSLEFNQLATELGIDTKGMALKDLIKAVHRALDEIPRYLLIFDNADNAAAIKDYLPLQNKKGHHLIITSRSQQWSNCIVLDTFSPEECWSYISTKVKDADKHHALELAKSVGYLPLALSQAVAYIQQEGVTIAVYLENYKAKGVDQGNDKVMGTWSMSMEKVKEKSPDAAFMLEACSYLNPDNIPLSLFEHPGLLGDPIKVQEAVRVMREYSLVQSSKVDNQIREHRLVQEASRSKEETTQTSEKIIKKVAKLKTAIESCYPKDKVKTSDYEMIRVLLPHIESLAENLKLHAKIVQGRSGVKELLQAHLKKAGANTKINDEHTKVETNQERFAAKMSDKLNAGAILQADLLSMVSDGLYTLGEYTRSKEVLQKVLDIRERHYGNDTPEVAIILTSLGITLKELGDYTASKEVLERALKIQEAHYKAEHLDIAVTLTALGITLYSTSDYAASQKVLEKALKIKESYYGRDNAEIAITLTALASSLYSLKDCTNSKELLNRALSIKENYYGMDHPEVATTLASLGATLYSLKDYAASKEALERALKIQENQYGLSHLKVTSILTSLYNTLKELGDHVGSRTVLERAIVIEDSYYGAAHPEVIADLLKLAKDIGSIGDSAVGIIDSEDIDNISTNNKANLEQAARILEAHYGVNHLIVATVLGALSYQIQELADYGTKQLLLERVLQIKEQHYGNNHPKTLSVLEKLAQVYKFKDISIQKSTLEKILKIKEYYYGLDHIEIVSTLEDLICIASKQGNTTTSKALLEKVLKIKENYYGLDHDQLISSLEVLSKIIGNDDNMTFQKEVLIRLLKLKDNYYQPYHTEILSTLRNLQEVLRKLDDVKGKQDNATRILEILSKQSSANYSKIIFEDLVLAIRAGHKEVALVLIDRGADVNFKNKSGSTPLIEAVSKNGLEEVAFALISKGANVNDKNVDGNTPLILAAKNGLEEVSLILINKGVDINAKNNLGSTPLIEATRNGLEEVALTLINKGANVNDKPVGSGTPLIEAVSKNGLEEVALALINKGANVNDKNADGNTPLILAIKEGHKKVALVLIDRGANINAKNNCNATPLIEATRNGLEEVALTLINKGANVNKGEGGIPLIWAAKNGLEEVSLVLINKGADTNNKDNNGNTPMIEAVKNGHKKIALALINKGANVNDKGEGGTPLIWAAKNGLEEVVVALINKRAYINDKNADGNTPLILAIKEGHKKVALTLIEKGANVNDQSKDFNTPLIWAAKNGLEEVAWALINKGANVNNKNTEGNTPLILAVSNGLGEVSLELIDAGADINAKNKRGQTVLSITQSTGKEELVKLLQAKINEKSVIENQDKEAVIVNAVTDIIHDNELLNYPELLKEPLKVFTLNQILDLSEHLNQALITEAITNNDSCLVLGALMSLSSEE